MRNLVVSLLLLWTIGFLAAVGPAQLTARERKGIEDALFVANLTERDLGTYAPSDLPAPHFPLLEAALRTPIDGVNRVLALQGRSRNSVVKLLEMIRADLYRAADSGLDMPSTDPVIPASVPEPIRPILARLIDRIAYTNAQIRVATRNLLPEERRLLIEGLPLWAAHDEKLSFDFIKGATPNPERMRPLVEKVNLDLIEANGVALAGSIDRDAAALRTFARTATWSGKVRFVTRAVTVEVSGIGDDTHTSRDTNLSIDLGGRDTYSGRYGVGIDYASVLIDCSGDDTYALPDLSLGAGLVGIGLAYDWGGSDRVNGRSLCLGAGLAGVGVFSKQGGDDRYESRGLSQGFGFFGVGLMTDSGGDDAYVASDSSQGCALGRGVGWLIDGGGNDQYRGRSRVQGFGGSDDERIAGGLGFLSDLGGSDTYVGDSEAQGRGDHTGLGNLYDAEGNDTYRVRSGGQGVGTDGGVGLLFDLAGDDLCAALESAGQGFGLQGGVGFLLDRTGNDTYAGRDAHPGSAGPSGLGMFLDAEGEDTYGSSVGSIGEGSIGLYIDLEGQDTYAEGLQNGQIALRAASAIAYDSEKVNGEVAISELGEMLRPGSILLPPLSERETLWSAALTAKGLGRTQALRKWVGFGLPGVRWVVFTKLASLDRSGLETLAWICRRDGDETDAILGPAIGSTDDVLALAAIRVARLAGIKQGEAAVLEALNRPALALEAAKIAGQLKMRAAAPKLNALAASPRVELVRACLEALLAMGDATSAGTAVALVGSTDLEVRRLATRLLAQTPATAMPTINAKIATNEPEQIRLAIVILAQMEGSEPLKKIGGLLTHPQPGVRMEALRGLQGRVPEAFRETALKLRDDADPLVRSVARRLDLGRF